MGTTTSSYQRKKREKPNQRSCRKKQGKIGGWYKANSQIGGSGGAGSA